MPAQPKRIIWKEILLIFSLCVGIVLLGFFGILILNRLTPDFMTAPVRIILWVIGFILLLGPFLGSSYYLYRRYVPRDLTLKRIKPAMKMRDVLTPWLIIPAFFIVTLLIMLLVKYLSHDMYYSDIKTFIWLVVGVIALDALLFIATLPATLKNRRMMERSSAEAVATILERRLVEHQESGEGSSIITYSYSFKLEFSPRLAKNAPELLVLKGDVSEKLGETMWVGKKIKIRYCTENPRILLLEGE